MKKVFFFFLFSHFPFRFFFAGKRESEKKREEGVRKYVPRGGRKKRLEEAVTRHVLTVTAPLFVFFSVPRREHQRAFRVPLTLFLIIKLILIIYF